MSTILSFENPMEFLLRYTVIIGIILMIIGVAILLSAKKITMVKRGTDSVDKQDRLYLTLFIVGICLLLIGMIVMAIDIPYGFYQA